LSGGVGQIKQDRFSSRYKIIPTTWNSSSHTY